MSSGYRKGGEKYLPGRLPPETSTHFTLTSLYLWVTGCGGGGYPETDSQPTRDKVASTLLEDIRIIKEYDYNHYGVGHTPVHPRFQGDGT